MFQGFTVAGCGVIMSIMHRNIQGSHATLEKQFNPRCTQAPSRVFFGMSRNAPLSSFPRCNNVFQTTSLVAFRRTDNLSDIYACINVKPEGGPQADVGRLTFQKNFGQNPHYGAPKFGQIRSNIPRCSINLY